MVACAMQTPTPQERFAAVHQRKDGVAAAEAELQGLLPGLAAQAGVCSLSYVTVTNQGEYLLELPVDRTVPKVVGCVKKRED